MPDAVTPDAAPHARRRRHPWRRRLGCAVALFVALGLAAAVALTRDPTPRILARRGTLAEARVQSRTAADGHVEEDLRLLSTSGLEVELRVRRPYDGISRPRAVMVLLGGLRTGRRASTLVPDTHGVVLAALSYPIDSERIGSLGDALAARRALLDVPAAVMLAVDHLLEQPYVDRARVELVGVSLGAPFACVAGGLDERFARVWSIHGGGDPARLIAHGLRHKVSWTPARAALGALVAALAHGPVLAPEDWVGRIAPRPFVMVNALEDEAIPRACVELLHAAAAEPKELVWIEGGHIDKHDVEQIQRLVAIVLERME